MAHLAAPIGATVFTIVTLRMMRRIPAGLTR